ncbi:MAG: efflux RND transporter permease subunit [Methylicorpusculum sp.]|uniref:efflux RND transporter permease subunit n=1 Tax=Methylicorpusculum sp. TaxID=2713644 RepID=UPI00271E77B3|nr:efflux RND transporter permease subunit [Methylicorpusculum sp.]MDO8843951.1 efflux RND transporter permease subunit [Methylicorpusculum sp.]MDO8939014.1 efflux RND transporter permease subunit [Methylicorpusculum sp.]MDO9238722.1 efflux RND transporter permease subunit [Methylicorpusculum sp.]MDP2201836.1 efflux RND transporter permease subunit [Methylicorpusculum sp.]
MKFTDLFIERPVLSSVISLLILVIGLRSLTALELRQYPETENTVVTVTTSYPGASSDLVQGFITTPLQQAIAEADGIDYLSSSSRQGISTIEAHMRLNYDPNAAVSEIQAKVASQRNVLPSESEDPVITSQTGDTTALMYIALYSDTMSASQISDYMLRVVQPKIQAVPGVGKAKLLGNKTFAMRIWLKPERMAALGITAEDVSDVLKDNNYLSGAGQTKGNFVKIDLSATTDVIDETGFNDLVVGNRNGTLVRLRDIADTEMGSEDYESVNWYKGKIAIFMGVEQAPGANPLTVANAVRAQLTEIEKDLPESLNVLLPYDASQFIQDSIDEVFRTLFEAVIIVLLIIYLTLGSVRAALVPSVTVPLSLIGGAILMLSLGYSINLLTMLAMVLAIGLVVDDAIIVVENIHRHIEMGESRIDAAIVGTRELVLPVVATTVAIIAVYLPIGFMGGLVGTLFTEFAFSLVGAVIISSIVALTLAPMLSSKVLKEKGQASRFEIFVEHAFTRLSEGYQRTLRPLLDVPSAIAVFAALVMISIYFMFNFSQKELAPTEDQSILFFMATGPQTATLNYNETYTRELIKVFETFPEYKESFLLLGFGGDNNAVFGGFKMPSAFDRERSQMAIQPDLQAKVNDIAGFQTAIIPRPSLPGSGGGLPLQFVMITDADYQTLDKVADQIVSNAMQSGRFSFLMKDVEFNRPKATLVIDRDRAADLGLTMQEIGKNLATLLGGQYVNRFSLQGRSYKVIPQVDDLARLDISKFDNYYLRTASGGQVPLSSLVRIEHSVEPSKRTQFQQLNSLTLNGMMAPGVSLGDAMAYLEQEAEAVFPRGFSHDYTGSSRQYAQQGSALILTFFMSLLVIYLMLAAQFESWRDPLIILISVPLSIASALAFIMLGFATINIYTQVGLITLVGLIAKNGILIVEFANQLQLTEGMSKRDAIEESSKIRLRPVLMTTVSMIVAMVPLLMASGPGAASRFDIGLVIASGLGVGTLFTLFVVPAFYLLIARDRSLEVKKTLPIV